MIYNCWSCGAPGEHRGALWDYHGSGCLWCPRCEVGWVSYPAWGYFTHAAKVRRAYIGHFEVVPIDHSRTRMPSPA